MLWELTMPVKLLLRRLKKQFSFCHSFIRLLLDIFEWLSGSQMTTEFAAIIERPQGNQEINHARTYQTRFGKIHYW